MSLKFNTREEWLQWRLGGIGSSDAPVIMGMSEYKSRHQLWLEKRSTIYNEPPTNWAMEMGKTLEPIAREKFNFWYRQHVNEELYFEERFIQHPQHRWLRASIDAAAGKDQVCAFGEIKFQGKYDWIYHGLPDKYFWQMTHQFMVTQCQVGFFIGISRWQDIKVVDVAPDSQALIDYFKECEKFWSCVVNNIEPGEMF